MLSEGLRIAWGIEGFAGFEGLDAVVLWGVGAWGTKAWGFPKP